MVRKISISITRELDNALTFAHLERETSKSEVVETFLREHDEVQRYIKVVRAEPPTTVLTVPRNGKAKKR